MPEKVFVLATALVAFVMLGWAFYLSAFLIAGVPVSDLWKDGPNRLKPRQWPQRVQWLKSKFRQGRDQSA